MRRYEIWVYSYADMLWHNTFRSVEARDETEAVTLFVGEDFKTDRGVVEARRL